MKVVSGKVLKTNAQHTEWHPRWLIHYGGRQLFYYETERDMKHRQNCRGRLNLKTAVLRVGKPQVERAETRRTFSLQAVKPPPEPFVFSVETSKRQIKFCVKSEAEMLAWAEALKPVMEDKALAKARGARLKRAREWLKHQKSGGRPRSASAGDGEGAKSEGEGDKAAASADEAEKRGAEGQAFAPPRDTPLPRNLLLFVRAVSGLKRTEVETISSTSTSSLASLSSSPTSSSSSSSSPSSSPSSSVRLRPLRRILYAKAVMGGGVALQAEASMAELPPKTKTTSVKPQRSFSTDSGGSSGDERGEEEGKWEDGEGGGEKVEVGVPLRMMQPRPVWQNALAFALDPETMPLPGDLNSASSAKAWEEARKRRFGDADLTITLRPKGEEPLASGALRPSDLPLVPSRPLAVDVCLVRGATAATLRLRRKEEREEREEREEKGEGGEGGKGEGGKGEGGKGEGGGGGGGKGGGGKGGGGGGGEEEEEGERVEYSKRGGLPVAQELPKEVVIAECILLWSDTSEAHLRKVLGDDHPVVLALRDKSKAEAPADEGKEARKKRALAPMRGVLTPLQVRGALEYAKTVMRLTERQSQHRASSATLRARRARAALKDEEGGSRKGADGAGGVEALKARRKAAKRSEALWAEAVTSDSDLEVVRERTKAEPWEEWARAVRENDTERLERALTVQKTPAVGEWTAVATAKPLAVDADAPAEASMMPRVVAHIPSMDQLGVLAIVSAMRAQRQKEAQEAAAAASAGIAAVASPDKAVKGILGGIGGIGKGLFGRGERSASVSSLIDGEEIPVDEHAPPPPENPIAATRLAAAEAALANLQPGQYEVRLVLQRLQDMVEINAGHSPPRPLLRVTLPGHVFLLRPCARGERARFALAAREAAKFAKRVHGFRKAARSADETAARRHGKDAIPSAEAVWEDLGGGPLSEPRPASFPFESVISVVLPWLTAEQLARTAVRIDLFEEPPVKHKTSTTPASSPTSKLASHSSFVKAMPGGAEVGDALRSLSAKAVETSEEDDADGKDDDAGDDAVDEEVMTEKEPGAGDADMDPHTGHGMLLGTVTLPLMWILARQIAQSGARARERKRRNRHQRDKNAAMWIGLEAAPHLSHFAAHGGMTTDLSIGAPNPGGCAAFLLAAVSAGILEKKRLQESNVDENGVKRLAGVAVHETAARGLCAIPSALPLDVCNRRLLRSQTGIVWVRSASDREGIAQLEEQARRFARPARFLWDTPKEQDGIDHDEELRKEEDGKGEGSGGEEGAGALEEAKEDPDDDEAEEGEGGGGEESGMHVETGSEDGKEDEPEERVRGASDGGGEGSGGRERRLTMTQHGGKEAEKMTTQQQAEAVRKARAAAEEAVAVAESAEAEQNEAAAAELQAMFEGAAGSGDVEHPEDRGEWTLAAEREADMAAVASSLEKTTSVVLPSSIHPQLHWLVIRLHTVADLAATGSAVTLGALGKQVNVFARVRVGSAVAVTPVVHAEGGDVLSVNLDREIRVPIWFPLPTFTRADELSTDASRARAAEDASNSMVNLKKLTPGWVDRERTCADGCALSRVSIGFFDRKESAIEDPCYGWVHMSLQDILVRQRERRRHAQHIAIAMSRARSRAKVIRAMRAAGKEVTKEEESAGEVKKSAEVKEDGEGAEDETLKRSGSAVEVLKGKDRSPSATAPAARSRPAPPPKHGKKGKGDKKKKPRKDRLEDAFWTPLYGPPFDTEGLQALDELVAAGGEDFPDIMTADGRLGVAYRGSALISVRIEGPEDSAGAAMDAQMLEDERRAEGKENGEEESDEEEEEEKGDGGEEGGGGGRGITGALGSLVQGTLRATGVSVVTDVVGEDFKSLASGRVGDVSVLRTVGAGMGQLGRLISAAEDDNDDAEAAGEAVRAPAYQRPVRSVPVEALKRHVSRYTFACYVLQGTELRDGDARVTVSVGPNQFTTNAEKVLNGVVYWKEMMRTEEGGDLVLPAAPSQIPDIVVEVHWRAPTDVDTGITPIDEGIGFLTGIGKKLVREETIAFSRIRASQLLGERWRHGPRWLSLTPTPAAARKAKSGRYRGRAGALCVWIGLGRTSKPVPPQVWERAQLTLGRTPPDVYAARVNARRLQAWRLAVAEARERLHKSDRAASRAKAARSAAATAAKELTVTLLKTAANSWEDGDVAVVMPSGIVALPSRALAAERKECLQLMLTPPSKSSAGSNGFGSTDSMGDLTSAAGGASAGVDALEVARNRAREAALASARAAATSELKLQPGEALPGGPPPKPESREPKDEDLMPRPELLDPAQFRLWKELVSKDPKESSVWEEQAGRRMSWRDLQWRKAVDRDINEGSEKYQVRYHVYAARGLVAPSSDQSVSARLELRLGEASKTTKPFPRTSHPQWMTSLAVNAELPPAHICPEATIEVIDERSNRRLGMARIPMTSASLVDSATLFEESAKQIRIKDLEGIVQPEINPNDNMPSPHWVELTQEFRSPWQMGDGVGLRASATSRAHGYIVPWVRALDQLPVIDLSEEDGDGDGDGASGAGSRRRSDAEAVRPAPPRPASDDVDAANLLGARAAYGNAVDGVYIGAGTSVDALTHVVAAASTGEMLPEEALGHGRAARKAKRAFEEGIAARLSKADTDHDFEVGSDVLASRKRARERLTARMALRGGGSGSAGGGLIGVISELYRKLEEEEEKEEAAARAGEAGGDGGSTTASTVKGLARTSGNLLSILGMHAAARRRALDQVGRSNPVRAEVLMSVQLIPKIRMRKSRLFNDETLAPVTGPRALTPRMRNLELIVVPLHLRSLQTPTGRSPSKPKLEVSLTSTIGLQLPPGSDVVRLRERTEPDKKDEGLGGLLRGMMSSLARSVGLGRTKEEEVIPGPTITMAASSGLRPWVDDGLYAADTAQAVDTIANLYSDRHYIAERINLQAPIPVIEDPTESAVTDAGSDEEDEDETEAYLSPAAQRERRRARARRRAVEKPLISPALHPWSHLLAPDLHVRIVEGGDRSGGFLGFGTTTSAVHELAEALIPLPIDSLPYGRPAASRRETPVREALQAVERRVTKAKVGVGKGMEKRLRTRVRRSMGLNAAGLDLSPHLAAGKIQHAWRKKLNADRATTTTFATGYPGPSGSIVAFSVPRPLNPPRTTRKRKHTRSGAEVPASEKPRSRLLSLAERTTNRLQLREFYERKRMEKEVKTREEIRKQQEEYDRKYGKGAETFENAGGGIEMTPVRGAGAGAGAGAAGSDDSGAGTGAGDGSGLRIVQGAGGNVKFPKLPAQTPATAHGLSTPKPEMTVETGDGSAPPKKPKSDFFGKKMNRQRRLKLIDEQIRDWPPYMRGRDVLRCAIGAVLPSTSIFRDYPMYRRGSEAPSGSARGPHFVHAGLLRAYVALVDKEPVEGGAPRQGERKDNSVTMPDGTKVPLYRLLEGAVVDPLVDRVLTLASNMQEVTVRVYVLASRFNRARFFARNEVISRTHIGPREILLDWLGQEETQAAIRRLEDSDADREEALDALDAAARFVNYPYGLDSDTQLDPLAFVEQVRRLEEEDNRLLAAWERKKADYDRRVSRGRAPPEPLPPKPVRRVSPGLHERLEEVDKVRGTFNAGKVWHSLPKVLKEVIPSKGPVDASILFDTEANAILKSRRAVFLRAHLQGKGKQTHARRPVYVRPGDPGRQFGYELARAEDGIESSTEATEVDHFECIEMQCVLPQVSLLTVEAWSMGEGVERDGARSDEESLVLVDPTDLAAQKGDNGAGALSFLGFGKKKVPAKEGAMIDLRGERKYIPPTPGAVLDYANQPGPHMEGGLMVDLERRWLSPHWHRIGAGYASKDRMRPVAVESRKLRDADGNEAGSVQMWIDVLTAAEAHEHPPLHVAPPPPIEMEVRVVVWRARNVRPIARADEGLSYVFARSWMHKSGLDYRLSRALADGDGLERLRWPGEQRTCPAVIIPAWESEDLAIHLEVMQAPRNDDAAHAVKETPDIEALEAELFASGGGGAAGRITAQEAAAAKENDRRGASYWDKMAMDKQLAAMQGDVEAAGGLKAAAAAEAKKRQRMTPEQRRDAARRERVRRRAAKKKAEKLADVQGRRGEEPKHAVFNWRMRFDATYGRWGRLRAPGPLMLELCEGFAERDESEERRRRDPAFWPWTRRQDVRSRLERRTKAVGKLTRKSADPPRWKVLGTAMVNLDAAIKRASLRPTERSDVVPGPGYRGVSYSKTAMGWVPLVLRDPNDEAWQRQDLTPKGLHHALAEWEREVAAAEVKFVQEREAYEKAVEAAKKAHEEEMRLRRERGEEAARATGQAGEEGSGAAGEGKVEEEEPPPPEKPVTIAPPKRPRLPPRPKPPRLLPAELLVSIEIVPKASLSKAEAKKPPGLGRSKPNQGPYLRDPASILEQIQGRRPSRGKCGSCCAQ